MYLIDQEGEIITREVKAKFINGKPEALEALYVMKSAQEWERFMRFMERYAEENDLGLSKNEA
jgi:photosystem II protein